MLDSKHTKMIGASLGTLAVCAAAFMCLPSDEVESSASVTTTVRKLRDNLNTSDTVRIERPKRDTEHTASIRKIREPHRASVYDGRGPRRTTPEKRPIKIKHSPAA